MTWRTLVLGWLLALFIVGSVTIHLSYTVSWTSVACARMANGQGSCRVQTTSLGRDEVYEVPLAEIGGTWLDSPQEGLWSGLQLWIETTHAPIAVSGPMAQRSQAEYVQHRFREFLSSHDAQTLSFEEKVPWTLWLRCGLVFLLVLLLPIVWVVAVAIDDVWRSQREPNMLASAL